MNRWRRLSFFLLLNVSVSALTVMAVLWFWARANPQPAFEGLPPVDTMTGEAAPASASNGEEPQAEPDAAQEVVSPAVDLTGQLEISSIIGAGDLNSERVLIRHVGDQELSLADWRLHDEDGNSFVFPALTMFNGGAVTVFSQVGANTVVELYWGLNDPVWAEGEQATLLDPSGTVQATFLVP